MECVEGVSGCGWCVAYAARSTVAVDPGESVRLGERCFVLVGGIECDRRTEGGRKRARDTEMESEERERESSAGV